MWSVQLSSAAQESLQTLSEEDRGAVLQAVGRLAMGPNPPGAPQPVRLQNRPDLFVLRARRYRVAYTVADESKSIVIVDVVSHDRLAGQAEIPAVR